MTSNRAYLIRALYEWITDNGMTPYLLVNAEHPAASLPQRFVEDGRIVLNISPTAVHGLMLGNDRMSFSARFGGMASQVEFPPQAVLGIYARENNQGMIFPAEEAIDDTPTVEKDAVTTGRDGNDDNHKRTAKERPTLRVVK